VAVAQRYRIAIASKKPRGPRGFLLRCERAPGAWNISGVKVFPLRNRDR